MKKTAFLSVLSISIFSACYAQSNKNAAPAYDNLNKEQEQKQRALPPHQSNYAAIEKESNSVNTRYKFSNSNKSELERLDASKTSNSQTQHEIKKYSFPKS